MNITVEGSEEYGNSIYGELFDRILIDLGLANRIEDVKMIIEPEKPLFLISVRMRQARTAVKVSDICSITPREGNTYMVINNESYAPALLALLWKQFGRDRIEQLTRLEVLTHGIPPEKLQDLTLDPGEELKKEVLDAIWRLLPEGFKTRHNLYSEKVMTIASTEHDMKPEFVKLAESVHQEMVAGRDLSGMETKVEDEEEEDEGGEP
jgi:putative methanogenesis marker protein 17